MASPGVKQLQFLNRVFQELIQTHRPVAIAVPGCSTGNGFEHIDLQITRRVVGIDIHPEYLKRQIVFYWMLQTIGDLMVTPKEPFRCRLRSH